MFWFPPSASRALPSWISVFQLPLKLQPVFKFFQRYSSNSELTAMLLLQQRHLTSLLRRPWLYTIQLQLKKKARSRSQCFKLTTIPSESITSSYSGATGFTARDTTLSPLQTSTSLACPFHELRRAAYGVKKTKALEESLKTTFLSVH